MSDPASPVVPVVEIAWCPRCNEPRTDRDVIDRWPTSADAGVPSCRRCGKHLERRRMVAVEDLLSDEAIGRARIALVDRFDDHEIPEWVAREVVRAVLGGSDV